MIRRYPLNTLSTECFWQILPLIKHSLGTARGRLLWTHIFEGQSLRWVVCLLGQPNDVNVAIVLQRHGVLHGLVLGYDSQSTKGAPDRAVLEAIGHVLSVALNTAIDQCVYSSVMNSIQHCVCPMRCSALLCLSCGLFSPIVLVPLMALCLSLSGCGPPNL